MGGLVAAIKAGWMDWEVEAARAAWQRQLDSGERIVVGLNKFLVDEEELPFELHRHSSQWEEERRAYLARLRAERDNERVAAVLRRINQEAATDANLMPAILDAVKVDATLGEISDAIRNAYGFKV
jgi:methylmalonyl-CoA mutase N-terminal domain/subunit